MRREKQQAGQWWGSLPAFPQRKLCAVLVADLQRQHFSLKPACLSCPDDPLANQLLKFNLVANVLPCQYFSHGRVKPSWFSVHRRGILYLGVVGGVVRVQGRAEVEHRAFRWRWCRHCRAGAGRSSSVPDLRGCRTCRKFSGHVRHPRKTGASRNRGCPKFSGLPSTRTRWASLPVRSGSCRPRRGRARCRRLAIHPPPAESTT